MLRAEGSQGDTQEMKLGEDAAPAAEVVLTHPLDIGSPAAEPAMLDASQEPALDALEEPVQGALVELPDVAAETSHVQAAEAAPGQIEASEEEDDEDRCDSWL